MCNQIGELVAAVNDGASVEQINARMERLREANLASADGDSFFYAIWRLADAWQGYLDLRGEADLSDGGEAFITMVNKVAGECNAMVP